MNVVQLWVMWANWNASTSVIITDADGDEIGVFQTYEDVLSLFGDKKVCAFASDDARHTVAIVVEV